MTANRNTYKINYQTKKTILMTKKIKFLILAFLVIVGRFYDAYTTYLYTPDLTYESNIIVKFFGAGWFSVIIFQALLVIIVIYCLYYYFFRYKTTLPTDNNLTKNEFISYLNFANTTSFYKIFYRTPNNKNLLFATIGYIASMTLIFVSYIVGTSTLFLLISSRYKELYKHGIPTILYCMIGSLAIYFSIRFYQIEYKKYKKSNF
ncbi:MAG TPA: hypothetical protein DEH02_06675 [Bacteroidales bacterium]|nr:hypothetical protein [Bacteroidales bacterium]